MSDETRLPLTLNEWQGIHRTIFDDATEEIEIEGSRMCAKTTLCLDKEIHHLRTHAGIESLLCRYSDTATRTKLIPRFERLCAIRKFTDYSWDSRELCYRFGNGSRAYVFGLKASNQRERYEKIRGLDVARVYVDQAEELPKDIGEELRASLRQKDFAHQITFSPNPTNTTHWLADKRHGGFPEDNSIVGRRYYRLSIYDNSYNLPPESVAMMERTFPPGHAKHAAMLLGKRGPNVIGDAVFEETFQRNDEHGHPRHVRPVECDDRLPILEGWDFGKHTPCYVVAQRIFAGGLAFLGGIIAEDLFLDDFIPLVLQMRRDWFGHDAAMRAKSCCPPPPSALNTSRYTNQRLLHRSGIRAVYRDNGNAPDVLLALIENLAAYMRQRNFAGEEAFAINADDTRWLKASHEGVEPCPFLEQAFEAGAVWDEHFVSVGNQTVRQVAQDDWFANALRCAQQIELNFAVERLSELEYDRKRRQRRGRQAGDPEIRSVLVGRDGWLA